MRIKITKEDLLKGCLISSLAHCISTNEFPMFAYEQSWNGRNFSINDSSGTRGTVTFVDGFCVGAIRNEHSFFGYQGGKIRFLSKSFPEEVAEVLWRETLSYLMVDTEQGTLPRVTSVFWCDKTLHHRKCHSRALYRDFELFRHIVLPEDCCIEEISAQNELDHSGLELLKSLYVLKKTDFSEKIILTPQQISQLPGGEIKPECIESFGEMNIFFPGE